MTRHHTEYWTVKLMLRKYGENNRFGTTFGLLCEPVVESTQKLKRFVRDFTEEIVDSVKPETDRTSIKVKKKNLFKRIAITTRLIFSLRLYITPQIIKIIVYYCTVVISRAKVGIFNRFFFPFCNIFSSRTTLCCTSSYYDLRYNNIKV